MVKKKDLAIVALATFCLTATLFMIKPIGSQSSPTESPIGTYDPWVDYNADGNVDIYDAITLAHHCNTPGDPTKNVNVTNWPTGLTSVLTPTWNQSISIPLIEGTDQPIPLIYPGSSGLDMYFSFNPGTATANISKVCLNIVAAQIGKNWNGVVSDVYVRFNGGYGTTYGFDINPGNNVTNNNIVITSYLNDPTYGIKPGLNYITLSNEGVQYSPPLFFEVLRATLFIEYQCAG
jgi:hypothetical protein